MMYRCYYLILAFCLSLNLWAAETFVTFESQTGACALLPLEGDVKIYVDKNEYAGVSRAAASFSADIKMVTGRGAVVVDAMSEATYVVVGTIDRCDEIARLVKRKKLDAKLLKGKTEKYVITVVDNTIVIAGSDRRGAIYGVYEFSRQMGVSPWYWWADVPVVEHDAVYVKQGVYTDGEPVVRYRGIFLNDEAPCLSGWVREMFPDSECASANPYLARGFNHNFYEKVFELLLRLKGNFMWPAMWGNAFYADDAENSKLADEMGIMMGTSHHEPMARNHQEWARHRGEYGAWDYATNQKVIDDFFREGVRRSKDNENLITIGMRGDGDAAMGGKEGHDDEYVSQDEYNLRLMEKIFANQRQIIEEETGRPAEKRQQVWALYKEVQHLYDIGLRVPDDVLILLCDDNWGNIRRVPTTQHKGGWGMYYHVDYVGAPRNTKWTNVTPIAHMWEQLNLSYQYGIDRMWILNVGDLKPMEYPIDFFMSMAWNPKAFGSSTFRNHTLEFFKSAFGEGSGAKAAEFVEKYCQYNGRVTPEMLNASTYNLTSGEWKEVVNEYKALEADALNLYLTLDDKYKDAYVQLVLFPVQSMANLYEMYYAQAKNKLLYDADDVEANAWADKVVECFHRDSVLTARYHALNNGKWNHMMDQTHIGYTSWQQPDRNICPEVKRVDAGSNGGRIFGSDNGYISIEAEHYYSVNASADAQWTVVPTYGRTKSAVALMPYTASVVGAYVEYRFILPVATDSVSIHVVTNSTLPFLRKEGHRYSIQVDDAESVVVNYNGRYTEDNQWEMYDIVATRVIETSTRLSVGHASDVHTLRIVPLDPGMVLEKIVVDYGGYSRSHLFGTESYYSVEPK